MKQTAKAEYGKQCGLCRKRLRSRMYYRPINGKYIRLCSLCWQKQEENA